MSTTNLKRLTQNDYNTYVLLKRKVMQKLDTSNKVAEEAMWEYIKFLRLAAFHENMIPSKVVDAVWHKHIQFTEDYTEFCNFITAESPKGSRYIHHTPSDPTATTGNNNDYQTTLNWYYTEYGEAPVPRVWNYHNKRSYVKYKFSASPRYTSYGRSNGFLDMQMMSEYAYLIADVIDTIQDEPIMVDSGSVFDTVDRYEVPVQSDADFLNDVDSKIETIDNSEKVESVFSSSNYSESTYTPDPVDTSSSSSSSCSSSSCSSSSCSSSSSSSCGSSD